MKILITENQLDDLLNVKISVNGGQSYTDYNVSSLKNGGLTLDCNPSDLKVICDTNILNYIKVFADGEKLNTGSGSGNTYAHKVEIKFVNFEILWFGSEGNEVYTIGFDRIASNSIESGVSVSGDAQELLNFYPFLSGPSATDTSYTKDFRNACHIYLKDADTENLVEGVGLFGAPNPGIREVGILFHKGTQGKYFNNTLVIEWGLEVSSGGGSNQTTIQELSVTENGTYNAGDNAAYNPVIVNVPSGGEDKLLCYYMHVVNLENGKPIFVNVIYTDKPATKISAGEIGGVEQSFYPADDGKHLFMTNVDLSGYQGSRHFVNLIYEDGNSIDLKGKFIYATQHN